MEGILLLCIGLIGYLFYRTHGQKHQLSSLQNQLHKLQQQFIQLQQQLIKPEAGINPELEKLEEAKFTLDEQATIIDSPVQVLEEPSLELEPRLESEPASIKPTQNSKQKVSSSSAKPTAIEQAWSYVFLQAENYFSQGNQIVRIGIIVLFFGMSFLAKYSIENSLIPVEVRMMGIFIVALIIMGIGWRVRIKNPAYGLIMQGGGIAVSYIAIFTSFKLYHLLPAEITFPLLILFSIFSMSLAIVQDSRALAITAITGGFAAPILASTGQGSHIGLFSYYLVLNCAIFFVAWFKSWRLLNVIGFLFTFIVASAWGVMQYRVSQFDTTEPFLIAFFLIYVAISILFSIKQKPELKGYVDGTLVFGVPMVGFGLQTALVHHMEYGLAYSAAALAVFYCGVAYALKKKGNSNLQLMSQAMFALAIIFATLTIPFALDGRWTAASWAIEGAGFVWIALRQQREILKYIGLAIQVLGGLLFLADYPYRGGSWVFLNAEFMGIAIITLSALFTARLIQQKTHQTVQPDKIKESSQQDADLSELKKIILSVKTVVDSFAGIALIIWGLGWWYIGGLIQVDDHVSRQYELTSYVAFLAASAGLWLLLSLRWSWQQLNFFPWLLVLPLCLYFWPTILQTHFIANYGFVSWFAALGLLYGILYKTEQENFPLLKSNALHSISYLLIVMVVAFELAWLIDDWGFATAWSMTAIMAVLVAALQLIIKSKRWPFVGFDENRSQAQAHAYQEVSASIIIALMLVWSLIFNFSSLLKAAPIPYFPILNPVDLIQGLALWIVVKWYRSHGEPLVNKLIGSSDPRWPIGLLASFIFVWFNILLLKTIHLISGVRYSPEALFDSALVQTSISIAWTAVGLILMVLASKKSLRQLWIIGAVLTAIVVAKLFLLDLSGQGTIERIISFIVVGALLLVVGYFSPVPPEKEAEAKKESEVKKEASDEE